jgi:hypothetical protein
MLLYDNMTWMLAYVCLSCMISLYNVSLQRVCFNCLRPGFSPNRFSPEWLQKREAKLEAIRPLHMNPT